MIGSLAEEFRTSSIPVREAIRRLEAEGLVVYEANKGARVTAADISGYQGALETLAILEGRATRLAAPHLGQEEMDELRRLNREMTLTLDAFDVMRYAELNRTFHRLIWEACPGRYLRETGMRVQRDIDLMRRTAYQVVPGRSKESVREHDRLVRMLLEKTDLDGIERFARDHKMKTLEAYREWEKAHGAGRGE